MTFIFGGAHQGKLAYALAQTGLTAGAAVSGSDCELDGGQSIAVLNGLHLAVRRVLAAGGSTAEFAEALMARNPNIVIISDEIGCGVVPVSAEERRWREETGRLCCELVKRADIVERVICGIAQRLK